MQKIIMSKVLRKFLILAFMLVGLIFVISNDNVTQPVQAEACCYECEAYEQDCIQNYAVYGYPSVMACNNAMGITSCYMHCSYDACSPGACFSNANCPYGYWCAQGTCTPFYTELH